MLTLKRKAACDFPHSSEIPSHVEWFPHITVDLSCWHGGQKLFKLSECAEHLP